MKRLLVLLMALCCTSCAALPAEERAFAVALCVEKADGRWQVHARVPAYKTGGEYLTVSGKGDDLFCALADMNASAPMQTALSQLRLLVLQENLAPADVSALFAALSGLYELRQQCAVAVTDASAKDVADALKPDTGTRLSKAIDVLLEARTGQGSIPRAALADVLRMGERQSPVLMRLTLRDGKPDLAGACPLNGENRILPPLDGEETALLTLLRGDTKELRMTVQGGHAHLRDVKVKVTLADDLRTVHVTAKVNVLYATMAADALAQTLADAGVQLLSRLSEAGCDALGLGRKAAFLGADMADWPARLRELRWEVAVQANAPA